MKIVFISDTHGMHSLLSLPEADMVIHAGDFMNVGRDIGEIISFRNWFSSLCIKHKICICGNHDILFDETHKGSNPYEAAKARELLTNTGILYLQDEMVEIEGLKIYGSPWTPEFMGWGFNRNPVDIAKDWEKIPANTDILVTHGPPLGILDTAGPGGDHLGSLKLLEKLPDIKPKVHVFGHIHGGRGVQTEATTYMNASFVKENYRPYSSTAYYSLTF